MASKSTLNVKNLEALGAERLAKLLIDISTGDTLFPYTTLFRSRKSVV